MLNPIAFAPEPTDDVNGKCACGIHTGGGFGDCDCGWHTGGGEDECLS